MRSFTSLLLLACVAAYVSGHGYMVEPAGRASAWRYGFDTPPDYTDNQCYCGGFSYQYQVNDGKCGICGDPWDETPYRMHEVPGPYATGILTQTYTKGSVISVTANVTMNHLGHFEYTICANNDITTEPTQECLEKTHLTPPGTDDYYLWIGSSMGLIKHDLQLPSDLICSQCVMQWRYITANTWGTCENGTQTMGCGPQEEFRGCADVDII